MTRASGRSYERIEAIILAPDSDAGSAVAVEARGYRRRLRSSLHAGRCCESDGYVGFSESRDSVLAKAMHALLTELRRGGAEPFGSCAAEAQGRQAPLTTQGGTVSP